LNMKRFIAVSSAFVCLGVTVGWALSINDIVNDVSKTTYSDYLNERLYTKTGDNRGNGAEHDLARTAIYDHFAGLGLDTSLDSFSFAGGTYYNVVAKLQGTSDDIVIVGAHYDSLNNPGADDNASGVAGIMEAARVLSEYQFKASIWFIAFDQEEPGLIGSQAFVNEFKSSNMVGMVSLDMIAYNYQGLNIADLYSHPESSSVTNGLKQAIELYGNGITCEVNGPLDYSDHAPFEAEGIAAALLIENWGNPYYHGDQDKSDLAGYLDYDYATNMTRSAVGYLATTANVVPEPATMAALVAGLTILASRRRKSS